MDLTRRCFAAAGCLAVLLSLWSAISECRRPQAFPTIAADRGTADATSPGPAGEDDDDDERHLVLLGPSSPSSSRRLRSRRSSWCGWRKPLPARRRRGVSRGPPVRSLRERPAAALP